jgi:pimeloyl-ACP methyl ester carboxylesterase
MSQDVLAPGLERNILRLGAIGIEVLQGGKGPVLLFLDGTGGFRPDGPFAGALTSRFHVVAPMLPGFGKSDLPDWVTSADDFAHIILHLLRELRLEKVVLVGASLGGWIAAEMATMDPSAIASLILVSPVGVKVGPVNRLDLPDIYAMPRDSLEGLLYHDVAKSRYDASSKSDEELAMLARNWESFALVTWDTYMHNPKLKHRLPNLRIPTLIVRGRSDGLVSQDYAERYASLIPGARLELIEEAGHLPQFEQPERFANVVNQFVVRSSLR